MIESVYICETEVIRETDKAIQVEIDSENIWIPKSQISDDSEIWKDGQRGKLFVLPWFAKQKGWD